MASSCARPMASVVSLGALWERDTAEPRQHGALARALRADHNELRYCAQHALEVAATRAVAHEGTSYAVVFGVRSSTEGYD